MHKPIPLQTYLVSVRCHGRRAASRLAWHVFVAGPPHLELLDEPREAPRRRCLKSPGPGQLKTLAFGCVWHHFSGNFQGPSLGWHTDGDAQRASISVLEYKYCSSFWPTCGERTRGLAGPSAFHSPRSEAVCTASAFCDGREERKEEGSALVSPKVHSRPFFYNYIYIPGSPTTKRDHDGSVIILSYFSCSL